MEFKKQIILLLTIAAFTAQAQDSLKTSAKAPKKKHELGVSIIVPLILAIGATDYNERYTNLTYRYFLKDKHAIKPFVGVSMVTPTPEAQKTISATNNSTLYAMNNITTPSNFQVGVGYEYIMGKKKLKHAIGADIYYNNKFLKEEFFYYQEIDSVGVDGNRFRQTTTLDTGAYIKTKNYDKLGFNLCYSVRYEASKRWVISTSTIMTNKFYWAPRSSNYEMNFIGLISDISIFYRF